MADVGVEERYFSRYLDTTGYGTGTKSAIGDYSSARQDFKIQPRPTSVFRVARMIVTIRDDAVVTQTGYGALPELTNGVQVFVRSDKNDVLRLDDNIPIKANYQWAERCFDVGMPFVSFAQFFVVQLRWTFEKAGVPIRLNGAHNEALVVRLNDDFTGLVDHKFLVQGYQETEVWQ